jgi:hypothetical protein
MKSNVDEYLCSVPRLVMLPAPLAEPGGVSKVTHADVTMQHCVDGRMISGADRSEEARGLKAAG